MSYAVLKSASAVAKDGRKVWELSSGSVVIDHEKLLLSGYNVYRDADGKIKPDTVEYPVPLADLCKHRNSDGKRLSPNTYLPANDVPPNPTYLVEQTKRYAGVVGMPELFWIKTIRSVLREAGATVEIDAADRLIQALDSTVKFINAVDLIHVIHLDFSSLCGFRGEPIPVFLNSGQHSREWLSQKCTFGFIQKLVTTFWQISQSDIDARREHPLAHYQFTIIPILNPLGFFATATQRDMGLVLSTDWGYSQGFFDRRQNRKKSAREVDLNRNADLLHGMVRGSDDFPEGECYAGPFAESEIEMRLLCKLIRLKPYGYYKLAFDNHSYSQVLLLAPSYDLAGLLEELLSNDEMPLFDTKQRVRARAALRDYEDRDFVNQPEIREYLEELAELDTAGATKAGLWAAEIAQLCLHHYGPRARANRELGEYMCTYLKAFSTNANETLGYEAMGTLSDWYYFKAGAAIGGMEIGALASEFASDNLDGLANQLEFPGWLYRFFLSKETERRVRAWGEIAASQSEAESVRHHTWLNRLA